MFFVARRFRAVGSVGRKECSVKCEVWRKQWEVKSVKCGVWSVECEVSVWSAKSAVWSVKCEVWSVKEAVRSEKCEVWSVECEVWSVKFQFGARRAQCEVWSVKCEVWSVKEAVRSEKCEVWSVECEVWSLECEECSVKCGVWSVKTLLRLSLKKSNGCRGKDTVGTGCLWTIGHLCLGNFRRRLARVYVRMMIITNIHLHARPTWNCLQASSPRSGPRGPCWTPVEWSVYYRNTWEHQFLKVDNGPLLLNSISVSPFCQWENVGTSLSNRCLNGWIVRGKHLGKFRATPADPGMLCFWFGNGHHDLVGSLGTRFFLDRRWFE